MMRLTEEQKMILNCYEGGKTKVIRAMHRSMEELESTGEDPGMLELLDDLTEQLKYCSNREFFQVKSEALIDPASDMDAVDAGGDDMKENIDKVGGEGYAEFTSKEIEMYCAE